MPNDPANCLHPQISHPGWQSWTRNKEKPRKELEDLGQGGKADREGRRVRGLLCCALWDGSTPGRRRQSGRLPLLHWRAVQGSCEKGREKEETPSSHWGVNSIHDLPAVLTGSCYRDQARKEALALPQIIPQAKGEGTQQGEDTRPWRFPPKHHSRMNRLNLQPTLPRDTAVRRFALQEPK